MTTLQKGGLLTAYKAEGYRAASQGAALVSRGSHKAAFVLPAAPKRGRSLPLLERVLALLDAELVQRDVVGLLLPDVLRHRRLVQPDGGDVVALGPEVPVAELVLEVRVLVEHHERALALQVPHEARDADLGRDADRHAHVVRHQVPLDYLDALVPAEVAENLPEGFPVLAIDHLSPILRSEHDVVLAHPLRVGQAVRLVCHGDRLSGPVRPEQTHLTPLGGRPPLSTANQLRLYTMADRAVNQRLSSRTQPSPRTTYAAQSSSMR